jgi:transmembrane sensor
MMQETDRSGIDLLLVKILQGTATKEEILLFSEWIKDYQNEIYFDRFKEMWHVSVDAAYIDANSGQHNSNRFIGYIRKSKFRENARKGVLYTISAAALIILFISVTHYIKQENRNSIENLNFKALSYSNDSVRVELNNGKLVKTLKGSTKSITNIEEKIAEKIPEPAAQQANVFNTVTTPSGERVAMVLSDGTTVYLTSNSYLKYPTRFDKDKREVTLVGRAYFEVKKSRVPFVVTTSDMNVEVLGTSFDVESRNSGSSASVILVEGSVKVYAEGKIKYVHPDEQMSLLRQTKEITIKKVDSKLMTMWKDGVLIVNGQSFEELVESLSSWYGVRIIDRTGVSKFEKFNGRFDREDIEAAIKAVAISANISYRIEDGKLILEDL